MDPLAAYQRVYATYVASSDNRELMQHALEGVRSSKPKTFVHLALHHVPKDKLSEVWVPDPAVVEVRQVFGSRYFAKERVGGWTLMAAVNPEDNRPYEIGWGTVVAHLSAAAVAPLQDVPAGAFPRRFSPREELLPPRKAPGKTVLDPPLVTTPPDAVPIPPEIPAPTRIRDVADVMTFDPSVDRMTRTNFSGAPAFAGEDQPMGSAPPLVPTPNRAAINQLIRQAIPEGVDPSVASQLLETMETVYASTNSSMNAAWDLMDNVFQAHDGAKAHAYALFSNMQTAVARASQDAKSPIADYMKHSGTLHAAFDASSLGLMRLAQRIAKESPDDAPTRPTIIVRHDAIVMAESYFDRLTGDDGGFQLADDLLEILVRAIRKGDLTMDAIFSRNWQTYIDRDRESMRLMCDGMRDAGDIPDKDRSWMLTFLEHYESLAEKFANDRADALLKGVGKKETRFGAPDDGSGDPPTSPVMRRRKRRVPRSEPTSGSSTPLEALDTLRRESSAERSNTLTRETAEQEDRIRIELLERLGLAPFLTRVLLLVWMFGFAAKYLIQDSALGPVAAKLGQPEWTAHNASSVGDLFFSKDSDDASSVLSKADAFMQSLDTVNRTAGGAVWDDAGRVNLDAAYTLVNQEVKSSFEALDSRNREILSARRRILKDKDAVLSSGAAWTRRLADLAITAQEISAVKTEMTKAGLPFPNVEAMVLDAAQENYILVQQIQQPGNNHMQAMMDAAHSSLDRPTAREGEAVIERRIPAHGWLERMMGIAPSERVLGTDSEPGLRRGLEVEDVEDALKTAAIDDGSYGADALQDAQRGDVARAVSANGDNLVAHTFGVGPGAGAYVWRSLPGTEFDGALKTLVRSYNTIADSVGYTVEQSASILERMKEDNGALAKAVKAGTVDLQKYNAAEMRRAILVRIGQMRTIYRSDPAALKGVVNATAAEYRAAFRLISRNNGMASFDESTTRMLMDSNNKMSAFLTTVYENILGPDAVTFRPVKDFATAISGLYDIGYSQITGKAPNREWGVLISYLVQTLQYWLIARSALDFVGSLLTAVSFRLVIATQSFRTSVERAATNNDVQAGLLLRTANRLRQTLFFQRVDPGVNMPGIASLQGMPCAVTAEEVQQQLAEGSEGIVYGNAIYRTAQNVLRVFFYGVVATLVPYVPLAVTGGVIGFGQAALAKQGVDYFVSQDLQKDVAVRVAGLVYKVIGSNWWTHNKKDAVQTVKQMSGAYALGGHSVSGLVLRTIAWRFAHIAAIAAVGTVADTVLTTYAQEPLSRYLNQSVSIGDGGTASLAPVSDAEMRALQSMSRNALGAEFDYDELFANIPMPSGALERAEDILEGDTQRLILQYTGETLEIFKQWLSAVAPVASASGTLEAAAAGAGAGAGAGAPRPTATQAELDIFEHLFIRRTSGRTIGATISLLVAMSRRT